MPRLKDDDREDPPVPVLDRLDLHARMLRPQPSPAVAGTGDLPRVRELFVFRSSRVRDPRYAHRGWRVEGLPTRVGRSAFYSRISAAVSGSQPCLTSSTAACKSASLCGELLGQLEGVTGLDQDVQTPACDLFALALVMFGDLGHVSPWPEIRSP